MSKTITFIDGRVADYQTIVASLDINSQWFLLDSDSDGISQIERILSGHSELDAIHIISHGSAGNLNLGNTTLNNSNITNFTTQLQNIGNALSSSGDILLYGCDVAQGDIGANFIQSLAELTQADVAASTNLTGNQTLGGDWVLESHIGEIDTPQLSAAIYEATLGLSVTNNVRQSFDRSSGEYQNMTSFAALRADGSVVTWGNASFGGDSSAVNEKINGDIDVTQIYSATYAFAALRADGSVVTWGENSSGGDSSAVNGEINGDIDVTQIYSSYGAFAALRADGSVVTWGANFAGGDSSAVNGKINGDIDVTQIYSTGYAFAALRADGSVVTWGNSTDGGDSSAVNEKINGDIDVKQIYSTDSAFAALRADGSVVTWGANFAGGDSSAVNEKINGDIDVKQIYSTDSAFAALRADGSVVTWGANFAGGDSSAVNEKINGDIDVKQIYSTDSAFAALRADGSVVTWGANFAGGDSSAVNEKINGDIDVTQINSSYGAFAALRADGSVVAWGSPGYSGDSSAVNEKLDGSIDVTQIYSSGNSFAALRADGSVVTWSGDSSAVQSQLNNVVSMANPFTNDVYIADANTKPSVTSIEVGQAGVLDDVVFEGSTAVYNVRLSAAGTSTNTYNFSLGSSALGSANIADYGAPTFSNGVTLNPLTYQINVPAGVASFSISVPIVADTISDANETLPLTIEGVTASVLIFEKPTVTSIEIGQAGIIDDFVGEGLSATFNVTLSAITSAETKYSFSLSGGLGGASANDYGTPTFTNGVTFNPIFNELNVPAGISSFKINLPTTSDSLQEGIENLTLTLDGLSETLQIINLELQTRAEVFESNGGEYAGMMRVMADFAKASYSLGDWEKEGDNRYINDEADSGGIANSADTVKQALLDGTEWVPLQLNVNFNQTVVFDSSINKTINYSDTVYLRQSVASELLIFNTWSTNPFESKPINYQTGQLSREVVDSTTYEDLFGNIQVRDISESRVYATINNQFEDGIYTYGGSAAIVARNANTAVISFRGTNDNRAHGLDKDGKPNSDSGTLNQFDDKDYYRPDVGEWTSMTQHYDNFKPLIDQFDKYITEHPEITKVYVTGHSLGAAMAMAYMQEKTHQNKIGLTYEGITFAGPAFDAKFTTDKRVTSIEIQDDPVPSLMNAVDPSGDILYFIGNGTLNGGTNNHSMDYYRALAKNVDEDVWKQLIQNKQNNGNGQGETEILLGATRSVSNSAETFTVSTGNDTLESFTFEDNGIAGLKSRVVDVLVGGAENDTLIGLVGYLKDERFFGGAGDDTIDGVAGDDTIDGGEGIDTAVFSKKTNLYSFTYTGANNQLIIISNADGTDTLKDMEQLQFADKLLTIPNGLNYIASNPDLIQFFGANPDSGVNHFLNIGHTEGRVLSFAALDYIAINPDLIRFFGANESAATFHYITRGFFENRSTNFDALDYIASNPDLIQFFGANESAATFHYITQGFFENRNFNFNAINYIAANPDLIRVFGANEVAASFHYINQGFFENRSTNFNALDYIASNPDLIQFFGADQSKATLHYINNGFAENRNFNFDPEFYLAKQLDLRGVFGTDATAATLHYINSGFFEGRVATNSGNDVLIGSNSADNLTGGLGKDILFGGLDADTFYFNAITESVVGANRDEITDFSVAQGDRIDLSNIDANTTLANDQAFLATILTSGNFTAAGQLKLAGGILSGNTDSNFTTAEFEIQLTGVSALTGASFVL